MINREEYSVLILELKAANSEIERLQAENKELREQSKTDEIIKLLKASGSGDAKQ